MAQAILTKPFRIGISSKQTLPVGTIVEIIQRGQKFILMRGNFQGLIDVDSFRPAQHQQLALFAVEQPYTREGDYTL